MNWGGGVQPPDNSNPGVSPVYHHRQLLEHVGGLPGVSGNAGRVHSTFLDEFHCLMVPSAGAELIHVSMFDA